jgi:hypothetical protein
MGPLSAREAEKRIWENLTSYPIPRNFGQKMSESYLNGLALRNQRPLRFLVGSVAANSAPGHPEFAISNIQLECSPPVGAGKRPGHSHHGGALESFDSQALWQHVVLWVRLVFQTRTMKETVNEALRLVTRLGRSRNWVNLVSSKDFVDLRDEGVMGGAWR